MSYTALYRKYRPKGFEDVVGQIHVTRTLKNQINSQKTSHAYLFCGTRGTGKTSTAKIFSKAINCLQSKEGNPCNICEICKSIENNSIMDVIEIDAASNNGVDNVREIREEVIYVPSKSRYKVYIIDEVHMLSTGAFNALLKTLEEPPRHVVFILATTEPHKIPATILSRCQRYDFKRITTLDIKGRVEYILKNEDIQIDDKSLNTVCKVADGSMRDALSILDQCIAFSGNNITYENIKTTLGIADISVYYSMAESILKNEVSEVINKIDKIYMEGMDLSIFLFDLVKIFRNILVIKTVEHSEKVLDIDLNDLSVLEKLSQGITSEKLISILEILSSSQQTIKKSDDQRITLEVGLIKACNQRYSETYESLIARIVELENNLKYSTKPNMDNDIFESKVENQKVKESSNLYDAVSSEGNKKTIDKPVNKTISNETAGNQKKYNAEKIWPQILDEIKRQGDLQLYGNLQQSQTVRIENNTLFIIFEKTLEIIKIMVERKNCLEKVQDIVNKILKEENLNIKCILEDSIVKDNSQQELDFFEQKKQLFPDKINIID